MVTLPPGCIDIVVKMLLSIARLLPHRLSLSRLIKSKSDDHEADWHEEVLPILSNILRSHCANAAIRSARILLTGNADASKAAQLEDPAVLVGAVGFFRLGGACGRARVAKEPGIQLSCTEQVTKGGRPCAVTVARTYHASSTCCVEKAVRCARP